MAGKNVLPVGSLGLKHAPPANTPVGVLNAPGPPLEGPVVPPGSSQTAYTSVPTLPVAKGLTDARSPAESPLPLESTPPDWRVTDCPVCARKTDWTWNPFTKVLTKRLSDLIPGIWYAREIANLCRTSRSEFPQSSFRRLVSCERRGFSKLVKNSLVELSSVCE